MKVKSRYQLLTLLSSGALSKTFLAMDEVGEVARKCAIAQLKYTSESIVDFELSNSEKLTIAKVNQAGFLPKFIDIFIENRKLYIVTEFIEGNNLKEVLATQAIFNESQIWKLLNDLLPTLNWLHQCNLIHQNVKPTNIIKIAGDRYKLLTPNLSQLFPEACARLCLNSLVSPEYSAPEQLKGESVFASDLYSLGITCIYLLTGIKPFDLFDSVNKCWIWQDYLTTKISGELERIINKLIHNDLQQRFSSVAEVLKAINTDPLVYLVAKQQDKIVGSGNGEWHCVNTLQLEKTLADPINSIALNPQDNLIAAGRDDKNIELWSLTDRSKISVLQGHISAVRSVIFIPNGRAIASASDDKTVKIWDVETGREIVTLLGHNNSVRSIVYSPCGHFVASGSWDKTIKIWSVETFTEICMIPAHKLQINAIAFSPNGKLLASVSSDRTVKLWDISTIESLKLRCTLTGHTWSVSTLAFHPTQLILASGSDDNTIKVWNYESGDLSRTINGHSRTVSSLQFTPDGKYLISASWDDRIKLWEVESGLEIVSLLGESTGINCAIASRNSQTIFTAGKDRTIKIWEQVGG
jgi:WD40 repeat protein